MHDSINTIHILTYTVIVKHAGTPGSVQLRGGIVPEAGTVEYCINGIWMAVCSSDWDYKDAFVVCRQLEFPATGKHVDNVQN